MANALRVVAVVAAFVLAQSSALGQVFTLAANPTANNGSGGVFMNFTPTASALQIVGFDTMFGGAAGLTGNVEVWTRSGPYVGFTAANTGWTLTQTITITSAGTTTLAPINLTTPIDIPTGGSTSVYVHGTAAASQIRYFGTGTSSNTDFSNGDLALFTNTSRTGTVPFAGGEFSPRAWTGNVYYTIAAVPEPTTMALCGLGLAGSVAGGWKLRKRRRSRKSSEPVVK